MERGVQGGGGGGDQRLRGMIHFCRFFLFLGLCCLFSSLVGYVMSWLADCHSISKRVLTKLVLCQ